MLVKASLTEVIVCIVMGAGIVQGLLLAIILLVKRTKVPLSNTMLSLLNLSFSLVLCLNIYGILQLFHSWPGLLVWPSLVYLLLHPLLYVHVATLLGFKKKLRWSDLIHLVPLLLVLFLWWDVIFMPSQERYLFLSQPANFLGTSKMMYMHHVYLVQGLIYTTYTLVLIGRFKRYNLVRWTKVTKSQMFYLKNIFIGLFFVLLIADGAWTFENLRTLIPSLVWLVIPLVNCVLIFSVSIITLNNSNLFYKGIDLKKPSYKSKELPQAEAVKYLEQLRDLMEGNQIYLNPELTLHDISMKLNIQPRQLSKILKIQLNTNFYDYINGFRVKKAKEMIADGKHNEWSLLAIALDSGFNSKSTFNRTFKKSLGCTPSEYISEMMTKKATVMHSRGTKEANA